MEKLIVIHFLNLNHFTYQESQVALRYIVKMCSASKFEANVRKRKAEKAAITARCIGIGGPTPAKRGMKSKAIP